jgi:hypothetical protein
MRCSAELAAGRAGARSNIDTNRYAHYYPDGNADRNAHGDADDHPKL